MTSHRLRNTITCLACLGLLAGCSSVTRVYDDIVDQVAPADTTRFYVAKAGVALYEDPNFSSSEIAQLALDEPVDRDRIEDGFAHVRVLGSGKVGWVDNAKLHWRAQARKDDAATAPPAAGPESEEPREPETEEEPTAPPPPAPAPTPAAPKNDAPDAPSKNGNDVNPALFDAF